MKKIKEDKFECIYYIFIEIYALIAIIVNELYMVKQIEY